MIEGWHEFYLLVGTSAAALTGLMFVVISISPETIAERPKAGVRAFVTVLLLAVGIHNAWDLVIWLAQKRRK